MSSISGMATTELSTKTITLELVTKMLNHLYTVTLGDAFYFNSIRLSTASIQMCCESFWHNDNIETVSDNDLDLSRVRSMIQLTRLIKDLEEKPTDQFVLFNIRERLRFISPFANPNRATSRGSRNSMAECHFLLMDQRTLTLSVIASLLKLCQILAPQHGNRPLVQPIINDVQENFIRPYSLILWGRAKRDLLA